jgi:multiple sugar transport system permease protein
MELMESAEIDGCSETGKFLRVIDPLSLPAMGAVGIFAFFGAYNDYLWQLIMISDKKLQTVPIGVAMFAQKSVSNLGYQLTAAALATVPLLIIFLYFQKFFIRASRWAGSRAEKTRANDQQENPYPNHAAGKKENKT